MKFVMIVFIVVLFSDVANAEISKGMKECVEKIKSLEWVINANPDDDALLEKSKGNTQFIAIGIYPNIIPSFTINDSAPIIKSKNYRIIKGTEPPACSEAHVINIQRAIDYASKYNQEISKSMGSVSID